MTMTKTSFVIIFLMILPICLSRRCEPWYYGTNCKKLCGMCKDAQCNEDDGNCRDGCMDGWRGNKCLDPCEDGRYGPNCSLYCSPGCKNKVCVKSVGVCSISGCESGYTGRWCNIPT